MKRYHDRNLVLSYNPRLAFICLPRGVGKSYGYKMYAIERFLKYQEQFIVIRRYAKELKECKASYFNDIVNNFPENKIELRGSKIIIDKKEAGHFIALSMAGYFKSSSFPDVQNILFDEMLPEGTYNRFLPDECLSFANIINTIERRRKNVRCFVMFNKISTITPYNIFFNIPTFDRNYFDKKRRILIWSEEEIDTETNDDNEQSDVSILFEGTLYKDYAMGGATLQSDETARVRKRHKGNTHLIYVITTNNGSFGVFVDYSTYDVYIDCNYDKTHPIKFNFDIYNLKECEKLFDKSTNYAKIVRDAIKGGYLYYNDLQSKMIASEIIKKF